MTVAEQIRSGGCDSELAEISRAIADRVRAGAAAIRWRIVIDDWELDVREDDLTLDEAFAFETEAQATWRDLDPLRSARDARALLVVLARSRLGADDDAARRMVGSLPIASYLAALTSYTATENPSQAQDDSTNG